MPKKFLGENSKAAESRAREAQKKKDAAEKKKQDEEDELWKDDDKNLAKKLQRKEEKEKKKHETVERKTLNKTLAEQELEALAGGKTGSTKVTQAEIAAQAEKQRLERQKAEEKAKLEAKKIFVVEEAELLQENVNRLSVEGEEARNVDEALKILGASSEGDKHPEKRLRSAYAVFEEKRMAQLKVENPNLRLSQLRQMLKKDWLKSPENPMNQTT